METMLMQITALQQEVDGNIIAKQKDVIPIMNTKDVDKPQKYDGTQFRIWYQNFLGFLESKDERFGLLLEAIKTLSMVPLTPESEKIINRNARLNDDSLVKTFKSQLFRYLQSYTKGESNTIVVAGGQDGAWESMRQLCDAGNSQQQYCQREERR